MENTLIHTENITRAKVFYQNVFDWKFNEYGPGDFLQIKKGEEKDSELLGALQSRKYSPLNEKVLGYECTIQVKDIEKVIQSVVENGGTLMLPKTAIPHVGWIAKFTDTEGNLFCAMTPDTNAR